MFVIQETTAVAKHAADLVVKDVCFDVVLAFHQAVDSGRATAAIDLFTEGAVLEVRGQAVGGRAAVLALLTQREADRDRRRRHAVVECWATTTDESTVEARALPAVLELGPDAGVVANRPLDVETRLRRDPSQKWRIDRRTSEVLEDVTTEKGSP